MPWSTQGAIEKTAFPIALFLAGVLGHRHPDREREERSAWAVVGQCPHIPVMRLLGVVVAQLQDRLQCDHPDGSDVILPPGLHVERPSGAFIAFTNTVAGG
jgi:hypothetical protein